MLFRKLKILLVIKNILFFLLSFLVVYSVYAQTDLTVDDLAKTIQATDLKIQLEIIAADSMEGRAAGSAGQKKAAAYIAGEFKRMGILPVKIKDSISYFQHFELVKKQYGEISITAGDKTFKNNKEILFAGDFQSGRKFNIELVFAGDGNLQDYKDLDVQNRGVVFFATRDNGNFDDKMAIAKKKGAKCILMIYGKDPEAFQHVRNFYRNIEKSEPFKFPDESTSEPEDIYFFIAPQVAESLFGKSLESLTSAAQKSKEGNSKTLDKIPKAHAAIVLNREDIVMKTENVLGIIPGREIPDEVVVITSHYDHLGKKGTEVYNGADDDGSGTVGLMELAEAYSIAYKNNIGPRRSVMFLAFTGEEIGLYGSEYYVSHPVYPLDKTLAGFNLDMIGRNDIKHQNDSNYVYIIGSDKISMELHRISERNNEIHTQLNLDYTYNNEDDPNRFYYRSDHYNFAKNGIPIIFYFTGVHEDYHRVSDTEEKIIYDKMELISRLVFYTSWEVANIPEKLSFE